MPSKLILSRKGFDGSAGGKPSPILDNKFVSLPIPSVDSGFFYKDMAFSSEENYLKIMKDLGMKMFSEAHLDPDLQRSLLDNRPEEWWGLFGQSGISQGTLHNRDVGEGRAGILRWFKEARKEEGVWKYLSGAIDIHAIFGFIWRLQSSAKMRNSRGGLFSLRSRPCPYPRRENRPLVLEIACLFSR